MMTGRPNASEGGRGNSHRTAQFLTYVSVHHSLCPVEKRELWNLVAADPQSPARLRAACFPYLIASGDTVSPSDLEIVVVATCNRFDVLLFGHLKSIPMAHLFSRFFGTSALQSSRSQGKYTTDSNSEFSPLEMEMMLRIYEDGDAFSHLCRVAASLDSLILGEPHIFGQLKQSYSAAREQGLCGRRAGAIFERSFQIAKRIFSETSLGRNPVSVGHAAVDLCRRVFDNLALCDVLVVGVGEMGITAARYLLSLGVRRLTLAGRSVEGLKNADELLKPYLENSSDRLTMQTLSLRPLAEILPDLANFDVMLVATSSPTPVISYNHVRDFFRKRDGRNAVVVDISVPRNVEPRVSVIENIFLFDIDDLSKVVEANRETRKNAARHAEDLIAAEVHSYLIERRARQNLAVVGEFHRWVRDLVKSEIEKNQSKKIQKKKNQKKKNQKSIADSEIIARAVAKKLVARPAKLARTRAFPSLDHAAPDVGKLIDALFELPPDKGKKVCEQSKTPSHRDANESAGSLAGEHRPEHVANSLEKCLSDSFNAGHSIVACDDQRRQVAENAPA